ncbi:MAG: glutaredoxin family protein [Proteobacteria bacterium]|nr:glutaredoxin family protein [Pseudomonadota bacterium]MBU1687836.1 glutaredoxin family protein [Pseudomonadota bacterium]
MTLFTKPECHLCEQLKNAFDLSAMEVNIEVLDTGDAGALAHLAWHGLVDTARKTLPILVLDDSSAVGEFSRIEEMLMARANQFGLSYKGKIVSVTSCESGKCTLQ